MTAKASTVITVLTIAINSWVFDHTSECAGKFPCEIVKNILKNQEAPLAKRAEKMPLFFVVNHKEKLNKKEINTVKANSPKL